MARIFITGSADGLGQLAAKALIGLGHEVVLHARNTARAQQAKDSVPQAIDVLTADLSSIDETKSLADKANAIGNFDAVIHNAGVYRIPENSLSADGLPILFAVNSLAPYILTCLMKKPQRLIYLTSGMHLQGNAHVEELLQVPDTRLRVSYSDTKLHDVLLAMAVARKWPDVYSNAVNPGWVPTKMGGAGAPDNLEKGYETQVWLAASNDDAAKISGAYFHHKKQTRHHPSASNPAVQDRFLEVCEHFTGVKFT